MDKPTENNIQKRHSFSTRKIEGQRRFKLISCEIIYREICYLVSQTEHLIDVEFLRKGLHDAGQAIMSKEIQEAIDKTDPDDYEAILLGYGRCNNGVVGLKSTNIPLVLPRAHDCITFFFGSCQAYKSYFDEKPGTLYRTTGWIERDEYNDDSVTHQLGLDGTYDEFVRKYGQDNAQYLIEELGSWENSYEHLLYIDMGLPADEICIQQAKEEAKERNLDFQHKNGDFRLLKALISGDWDEKDFLIVQPGQTISASDDDAIMKNV